MPPPWRRARPLPRASCRWEANHLQPVAFRPAGRQPASQPSHAPTAARQPLHAANCLRPHAWAHAWCQPQGTQPKFRPYSIRSQACPPPLCLPPSAARGGSARGPLRPCLWLHRPPGGAEGRGHPAGGPEEAAQERARAGAAAAPQAQVQRAGPRRAARQQTCTPAHLCDSPTSALHLAPRLRPSPAPRSWFWAPARRRWRRRSRRWRAASPAWQVGAALRCAPAVLWTSRKKGANALRSTAQASHVFCLHPSLPASSLPFATAGVVKFDSAMAHCITAGADFMLVPSRFEPCGLIQLHAMQVHGPPVVVPPGFLRLGRM